MKKNGLYQKIISQNKKTFVAGTILAFIGAIAQTVVPNQIRKIADYVQVHIGGEIDLKALYPTLFLAILLIVLYGGLTLVTRLILATATGNIGRDLRAQLDAKTDRLPLSFMDKMNIGDFQSRIVNDVDTLVSSLVETVVVVPTDVVKIVIMLGLMFWTNWQMTLTLIATNLLGLVASAAIMKRSMPQNITRQGAVGAVNAVAAEALSGHLAVKAFGCEEDMAAHFEEKNQELEKSSILSKFYAGIIYPVSSFTNNLGYIGVCITAALLFAAGNPGITIGKLAAFIIYVGIFSTQVSDLIVSMANLQPGQAAAVRLEEILNAEEITNPEAPRSLEKVKGGVVFDHVTFGYLPDHIVLKDLSAKVEPGQKVAIVGPTGAGKSTFVNLLMRFYEAGSGSILLDGVPITEMNRDELHSYIGMVLQDTWTFTGTVRDNIVYSTPGVTDERLQEIIEACGLSFFIDALPEGLDTVIGEESEVSAGQRQLLTIARAMAKDAPVLILDEATSNIDTRTELAIQRAIDQLTKGRTSFVIAHRLSTIRNADCIFVMKDGDVIEIGTHDELLKKDGLYKELYYSQFDPV